MIVFIFGARFYLVGVGLSWSEMADADYRSQYGIGCGKGVEGTTPAILQPRKVLSTPVPYWVISWFADQQQRTRASRFAQSDVFLVFFWSSFFLFLLLFSLRAPGTIEIHIGRQEHLQRFGGLRTMLRFISWRSYASCPGIDGTSRYRIDHLGFQPQIQGENACSSSL